MYRYDSLSDFLEKVDHEGGLYDALSGYGLGVDNLPEDAPADFVALVSRASELAKELYEVEEALIEYEEDDE